MSDKWIKEEIIAVRYPECRNGEGEVDADRLTRVSLLDLGSCDGEYAEFVSQAERQKMRRLVNEYCTAARRSREASGEAASAGELPLPGLEEVVEDRVAFMREGERLRKETLECDEDDLAAVIRDYQARARALEQAVLFYVVLRQHLIARGVSKVRDLYAA